MIIGFTEKKSLAIFTILDGKTGKILLIIKITLKIIKYVI